MLLRVANVLHSVVNRVVRAEEKDQHVADAHMQRVKQQLEQSIDAMQGDWVIPKNNYERRFCDVIGWKTEESRYYDATTDDLYIEIKKGQSSMWFDMVRYAEIMQGTGTQNTITVFIKYDKKTQRVDECFVIDTHDIVRFMGMTDEDAEYCIRLNKSFPRGLNMQASACLSDMRSMATYVVQSSHKRKRKRGI